jgi:hypothetical protein
MNLRERAVLLVILTMSLAMAAFFMVLGYGAIAVFTLAVGWGGGLAVGELTRVMFKLEAEHRAQGVPPWDEL